MFAHQSAQPKAKGVRVGNGIRVHVPKVEGHPRAQGRSLKAMLKPIREGLARGVRYSRGYARTHPHPRDPRDRASPSACPSPKGVRVPQGRARVIARSTFAI